jgi:hypothetical protein
MGLKITKTGVDALQKEVFLKRPKAFDVEQEVVERNYQGKSKKWAGTLHWNAKKEGAASGKAGSFIHAFRDTKNSEGSLVALIRIGPSESRGRTNTGTRWYYRRTRGNVSSRAHGHSMMASISQAKRSVVGEKSGPLS